MLGECAAVDTPGEGLPSPGVSANKLEEGPSSSMSSSPRVSPVFVLRENMTRLDLYKALIARSKLIRGGRPQNLNNVTRFEILTSLLGDEYATGLQSHKLQVQQLLHLFIKNIRLQTDI